MHIVYITNCQWRCWDEMERNGKSTIVKCWFIVYIEPTTCGLIGSYQMNLAKGLDQGSSGDRVNSNFVVTTVAYYAYVLK